MRTCRRRRRRRRSPLLMRVRAPGRAEAAPACSGAQTWPRFPTWAQKGRVKSEGDALGTTRSSSCPRPEELPKRPPALTGAGTAFWPRRLPRLMRPGGRQGRSARDPDTACLATCDRAPGLSSLTPTEGKVLSPPHPEVPTCRKPAPAPARPKAACALTLSSRPPRLSLFSHRCAREGRARGHVHA